MAAIERLTMQATALAERRADKMAPVAVERPEDGAGSPGKVALAGARRKRGDRAERQLAAAGDADVSALWQGIWCFSHALLAVSLNDDPYWTPN